MSVITSERTARKPHQAADRRTQMGDDPPLNLVYWCRDDPCPPCLARALSASGLTVCNLR